MIRFLHKRSVAYAATSLGATMMNSVFMFNYVKVYLDRYHVSETWFHMSQIVFMVWNAINDPLFGYLQDNYDFSWVKSRRHSILYGAPIFALSFLVPWFPWGDYSKPTNLAGFQLMFSLCFYDALFTFVLLAQCALFAEMSQHQEDRLRLIRYSQIAGLCGSSSVFFSNYVSGNMQHYGFFQITTIVIAVLAFFCMFYSGKYSESQYDKQLSLHRSSSDEMTAVISSTPQDTNIKVPSMLTQVYQVFSQRSFVSFVIMNLLQVFHVTWLSNFTAIVFENLVTAEAIPQQARSVFFGSLFILPQLVVIFGYPIVRTYGYYRVIKLSFIIKIFLGVGLFYAGPSPWVLMLFFVLEYINCSSVFSTFNLCLSDIIDIDMDKYQREHPLSSMVFGCNALVTKPAQSLAPMLVVAIFNMYGYQYFKEDANLSALSAQEGFPLSVDKHDLIAAMFYVTCLNPVIVGVLQLLIWNCYTIRNSHITIAKHVET